VLCAGKAKLSAASGEGKIIITKISEHGDVLGLNATISNRPYEVTAEMLEPGQATPRPFWPSTNNTAPRGYTEGDVMSFSRCTADGERLQKRCLRKLGYPLPPDT